MSSREKQPEREVRIPEVGDDIYVDTKLFMGHGEDDVIGGKARVNMVVESISGGEPAIFVVVDEQPGLQQNWTQYLAPMQEELEAKFGDRRAYPSPDYRPEFNRD